MQSKGRDVEPNEGAERSARASVGRDQDRMKVLNEVRVPSAKQREYAEQREGAEAGHGPGGKWRARLDTAENKPNTDARPYLRVIMPEKPEGPNKDARQCGEYPKCTERLLVYENEQNRSGT